MKLESVEIENYRAIEKLRLPLDPSLTVLHGDNTCGKTSVLSAIAVGLGVIPELLPGCSGIDFLDTDVREDARHVKVALTTTTDRIAWKRRRSMDADGLHPVVERTQSLDVDRLRNELKDVVNPDSRAILPIVAFYDTDRAVLGRSERGAAGRLRRYAAPAGQEEMLFRGFRADYSSRCAALNGALEAYTDFSELFTWFYARENDELREQKKRSDFSHRLNDLSAVRRAIESMLDGVSDARIGTEPLRFSVSATSAEGKEEEFELDQLSDGQRAILALAADLAWRMARGNPHLENPLASEAIVLIDEVGLHLHPSWQQRVLSDLRRTFPNAQFIVSSHSPQVLTTVGPEHIVELAREDGRIVAGSAAGWTYGAESGDVLSVVMGVDERPVNDFTRALARYRRLVSEGRGDSREALTLRATLDGLSPDDPALVGADLEIRRRRLLEEMAKSP